MTSSLHPIEDALKATMSDSWTGTGEDVFPTPDGPIKTKYTETTTFGEPFWTINPGGPNNGSQELSCINYITKLVNYDTKLPMHQECGYWLFDVLNKRFIKAIAIPRGISILAGGTYRAEYDRNRPRIIINASAKVGEPTFGISSDLFLSRVSPTTSFTTTITLYADSYHYNEDSILKIGKNELHHTDEATLNKVK